MSKHIMNKISHSVNTIIPFIGILVFWIWWIFPLNIDIGLIGFFILMYVVSPISAIWGLSYSIYKKIWRWTAAFMLIGVLPWLGLRFGPDWLYEVFYKPLSHLFK